MKGERGEVGSARTFWVVFLAALVVRLLAVQVTGAAEEARGLGAWEFGHEAACTAQAWLTTATFGDPWGQETGPSGWIAPPYPMLVAFCLAFGGGIGPASAWILFIVQALLGALAAALLVPLGAALFDQTTGRLAAWMLVLHPLAIYYATAVWDTTASILAVVLVVFVAVRLAPRSAPGGPLVCGLVQGAAALVNPACLALFPVVTFVQFEGRAWRAALGRIAWILLGTAVVVSPWMVRNARTMGSAGLRTNFGVELRVGNGVGATGRHETDRHPSHSAVELERYREMGEVSYAAWSRDRALEWIRANPVDFLAVSARRLTQYWFGEPPIWDTRQEGGQPAAADPRAWMKWIVHAALGLAALSALIGLRSSRGVSVLFWVVLAYPLPYYLTHVSERYRLPIEPIVLLLAAAAWSRLRRRGQGAGDPREPVDGGAMLRP